MLTLPPTPPQPQTTTPPVQRDISLPHHLPLRARPQRAEAEEQLLATDSSSLPKQSSEVDFPLRGSLTSILSAMSQKYHFPNFNHLDVPSLTATDKSSA